MIAAMLFAGSTFAQDAASTDLNDPLKEEAMQQTNDLDAIVNLSEDQRSKVFELYTGALRQEEAIKERYAQSGADLEADKEYIKNGVDRQMQIEFQKILSEEQYDAWKVSTKK